MDPISPNAAWRPIRNSLRPVNEHLGVCLGPQGPFFSRVHSISHCQILRALHNVLLIHIEAQPHHEVSDRHY